MIRAGLAVALGLTLASSAGLLKGCPAEGDPGGSTHRGNPAAVRNASHPISFLATWQRGWWVNIDIIVDGEAQPTVEKNSGEYLRTIDVTSGKRVELLVHPHADPSPGATACKLAWFSVTLQPNGYEHRQDGTCHAWGDVPNTQTQG